MEFHVPVLYLAFLSEAIVHLGCSPSMLLFHRQEFFKTFFDLLSFQADVTDLRAIEETYVPVIKFK